MLRPSPNHGTQRLPNDDDDVHFNTVVPVMNGHPRDQAKVSVHCRWPLVTGTDGQAGDAKYNTPCNTTYRPLLLSPPAIFLMNTRIVVIRYAIIVVNLKLMQHNN